MRRLELLRAGRTAFRVALLALLASHSVGLWSPRAAGADEAEEERLEAIERHTERAWQAFRSGNHEEVIARLKRIARYDPESPLPAWLGARVELRVGRYAKALELAEAGTSRHPGHKGLESVLFDVLLTLGRSTEVEETAEARVAANGGDGMAHAALGLVHELRGRREAALQAYEAAIATYSRASSPSEDIPWIAKAAIQATWLSTQPGDDLLNEAAKLMSTYLEKHPEDQDVLLMIADLYQSQRSPTGQSLAGKYYLKLLKENSEVAEARVGLARKLLVFYQQDRAIQELERALATNESLPSALALLAAIHVGNGYYEKADGLLERALQVNPVHREARAVKAARLWITGQREAFDTLQAEVLAFNPTDGRFFVTISDLVGERQRRYDVAAELAARAIEVDPNDPLGYVTFGEALMNLGRTEEAREQFHIAVEKSKRYKDVKRDNWLEVLGVLDGFRTVTTPNFVIRMHPSEADVMERYLPDLMEDSWKVLSQKYGIVPASPVFVDSFHRADDFSVRSVGVAGLPALGVCFGGVITLLGPTSRPLSSFSWARTAWHEFAHVITLQQSKGQVPRWLTEGLSVDEEKARRSNWSREMERQLFDRYHNDRLLRMDAINRAFRGGDIMFAYYQGGLIAEHLTMTRGFDVIPEMLRAFAEDRTTAEVFKDVLDLDLADYDRQFKEFVGGIVGEYEMVPRWDGETVAALEKRVQADPQDGRAWARLGWARLQRGVAIDAGAALGRALALLPDDPEVILLSGRLAEANGRADLALQAYERYLATGADDLHVRLFLAGRILQRGEETAAAIPHLEAAKACFPYVVGKESPYLLLAQLYRGGNEIEKAIAELEGYVAVAGEDYERRKELKAWYRDRGDHARVVALCGEMVEISPFGADPGKEPDLTLHQDYANALLALDREDEALRELEVQVALVGMLPAAERLEAGAVDTHLRLGETYLAKDRPLDALEQAIAALRLSPEDAQARMLKARAEEAAGYR